MKLISMVLTAALVAVSFCAQAQSDDVLKHAATMDAIGKLADAMGKQAEALRVAVERGGNSQPMIMQAAAPLRDCTGWAFLGCAIRETWGGVKDVIHEVAPFAAPIAQYRTSVVQYKYQEAQSKEQTAQVAAQQGTLQFAFGAQRDVGIAGINRPTPVTPPSPPTSQIIVTANTGPVQVGSGTQANSSYNPINPTPLPPRICTTNAAGVLTCQGG